MEVQLLAGGTQPNDYYPHFDVSVGGDDKGRIIGHDGLVPEMKHPNAGGTAADWPGGVYTRVTGTLGTYLMSFTEMTDSNGDIVVLLDIGRNEEFGLAQRVLHNCFFAFGSLPYLAVCTTVYLRLLGFGARGHPARA